MIVREITGMNGRKVKLLRPENQADIEEIRRLDEAGEIDTRHSFADDPERLPLETQDSRTGPQYDARITAQVLQRIDRFEGEFAFLSNFHRSPVEYEGITYPSSEHAFQAAKSLDPNVRECFRDLPTPKEAKELGRRIEIRSDWHRVKVGVMERILEAKFRQNSDLRERLLATGDAELIEGNHWRDSFWGVYKGGGKNELGRALMRVRDRLREAQS